jgi:hypothetical protein
LKPALHDLWSERTLNYFGVLDSRIRGNDNKKSGNDRRKITRFTSSLDINYRAGCAYWYKVIMLNRGHR